MRVISYDELKIVSGGNEIDGVICTGKRNPTLDPDAFDQAMTKLSRMIDIALNASINSYTEVTADVSKIVESVANTAEHLIDRIIPPKSASSGDTTCAPGQNLETGQNGNVSCYYPGTRDN